MNECTDKSPVNITLNVMGGKWKPLILWHLQEKPLRFSQLQKLIGGITQKMLTQQLRELEAESMISRKVYAEVPPRVEYTLTEYGVTLNPVLKFMADWGNRHLEKRSGTLVV